VRKENYKSASQGNDDQATKEEIDEAIERKKKEDEV